jgi:hypothetical protein
MRRSEIPPGVVARGSVGSTGCRLGSGMGAVQFFIVEPG